MLLGVLVPLRRPAVGAGGGNLDLGGRGWWNGGLKYSNGVIAIVIVIVIVIVILYNNSNRNIQHSSIAHVTEWTNEQAGRRHCHASPTKCHTCH